MTINRKRSGQSLLLLTVLTVVAATTIGAALVTQSEVQQQVSTNKKQNEEAFSAADAGVAIAVKEISEAIYNGNEPAAVSDRQLNIGTESVSSFSYDPIPVEGSGPGASVDIPRVDLPQNKSEVYFLESQVNEADVTVNNPNVNDPNRYLTLAVDLFRDVGNGFEIDVVAYKCPGASPQPQSSSDENVVIMQSSGNDCSVTVTGLGSYEFMRFRPLLDNAQNMQVVLRPTVSGVVPRQGYEVFVIGKAGQTHREIVVYQTLPHLGRLLSDTFSAQSVSF